MSIGWGLHRSQGDIVELTCRIVGLGDLLLSVHHGSSTRSCLRPKPTRWSNCSGESRPRPAFPLPKTSSSRSSAQGRITRAFGRFAIRWRLDVDGPFPAGCSIEAWRPAVAGISEVFHAHIIDFSYPLHSHDSWTVLPTGRPRPPRVPKAQPLSRARLSAGPPDRARRPSR